MQGLEPHLHIWLFFFELERAYTLRQLGDLDFSIPIDPYDMRTASRTSPRGLGPLWFGGVMPIARNVNAYSFYAPEG